MLSCGSDVDVFESSDGCFSSLTFAEASSGRASSSGRYAGIKSPTKGSCRSRNGVSCTFGGFELGGVCAIEGFVGEREIERIRVVGVSDVPNTDKGGVVSPLILSRSIDDVGLLA